MQALTFVTAKKIGDIACSQAIKYYEALGHTVTDVQGVKFFQALDVDLMVDGLLVEVKGDTCPRYNNLFIEVVSNTAKGLPGWAVYCQADYIFYYFLREGKAVVLPVPAMQEWISKRAKDFRVAHAKTVNANGSGYTNIGHLCPIAVLLEEIEGSYEVEMPALM